MWTLWTINKSIKFGGEKEREKGYIWIFLTSQGNE